MGPGEQPLHAAGGVDGAVDQVVRLGEFREAHPAWRIWVDRDSHIWHAERLLDGGRDELTRYDLRWLLDELERRERG